MKKQTVRLISLILLAAMLLSTAAFAATLQSDYIYYTSCSASRSGNTVTINFSITGKGTMTKIGSTSIYLYENAGSGWSLVKTYSYLNPLYAATLMGSNTYYKNGSVTYNGVSGRNYYAVIYYYAGNSSGSDSTSANTNVV